MDPYRPDEHSGPNGPPLWVPSLLIGVCALALVQWGAFAVGAWGQLNGTFTGPDSYMRLTRVLECWGGQACTEGILERSNAPFGEALHWPWLWDWILIGLATPLRLFLDLETAVVVAGYAAGPLLGVLTIGLLTFAAKGLRVTGGLAHVGLLTVCQPYVVFLFSYSRPDHHGIQAALFIGALLAMIGTIRTLELRWARLFGVMFGLGVWVSTEGLITALPLLVAMGLLWTVGGAAEAARANREASAWASGTLLVGLLIDGPLAGIGSVEFDRLSVVHVALCATMAAFWTLATWWAGRGSRSGPARWMASALGASAAFAMMTSLFPGFERGPAADMPEALWTLWLHHTAEYVPLIRRTDATEILMAAAPFLLAAPLSIWAALKAKGAERYAWWSILGTLAWFEALATLQQVRWSTYVHLMSTLAAAWLLGRLLSATQRYRKPLLRSLLRISAVTAMALGPVAIAAGVGLIAGRTDYEVLDQCEPSAVIDVLAKLAAPAGGPATILAPIFWGPEILFRTDNRVVATPYHRNTAGIMDSHQIMSSPTVEAHGRILDRGISHIAWCPRLDWLPLVDPTADGESLYADLVDERYPRWAEPITLQGAPGVRVVAVSAPE